MGRKHSSYKRYESEKGGSFVRIFHDMRVSDAYKDLSADAKDLYTIAKDHYTTGRDPIKEHPEKKEALEQYGEVFYLNQAMLSNVYGFCANNTGSHRKITRTVSELIEHGFICRLYDGKRQRNESIYCFSDGWKHWHKPP